MKCIYRDFSWPWVLWNPYAIASSMGMVLFFHPWKCQLSESPHLHWAMQNDVTPLTLGLEPEGVNVGSPITSAFTKTKPVANEWRCESGAMSQLTHSFNQQSSAVALVTDGGREGRPWAAGTRPPPPWSSWIPTEGGKCSHFARYFIICCMFDIRCLRGLLMNKLACHTRARLSGVHLRRHTRRNKHQSPQDQRQLLSDILVILESGLYSQLEL